MNEAPQSDARAPYELPKNLLRHYVLKRSVADLPTKTRSIAVVRSPLEVRMLCMTVGGEKRI